MSKVVSISGSSKKRKQKRKPGARLPFLFYFLILLLVLLGARVVDIQAVKAEKLDSLALEQRVRSLELTPDRGKIFDRNGEIMAISVDMDTIFATPYQVKKPRVAAKQLAEALDEKPQDIYEKLTQESGFVYLRRKADRPSADRVKALDIEGVGIVPESKRFYPGKTLASQTIGFVGLDNVGLTGLELAYDSVLKGEPGRLEMEQDLKGRPISGTKFRHTEPTDGQSLVLTIDKEIQYKAQLELKKAVKEWEAAGGWIMVMDSQTGEIYALANEPTFDLNKFSEVKQERLRNRVITDVYEPGSTMKIVTAAAALEERLFSPSTQFDLPGTLGIGGHTIKEAHPRGQEIFSFSEIVTKSSNVGAVKLGLALGEDRLYEYVQRFGMNQPTYIGLAGEGQGYCPEPDLWSATSIATIPFGQGMSATAPAVIRAVNVVASGGRLVQPKIVKNVGSTGSSAAIKKAVENEKTVISAPTAEAMAKILGKAVAEGTGKNAQIDGYEVGGKTGTAQKPKVDALGYDPGKYISSFVGFTPVADPAITILVAIDEPQGAIYGGVVAAPVFAAVGEFALQQLRVTP